MNLKELRIGNLIQDGISKTLLEVDYISEKSFSAKVIDRDKFPLSYGWKAEEIPITEKWLIDFGWGKGEYDTEYQDNFSLDQYVLAYNVNANMFTLESNNDLVEINHIKYVHQLQNLYFALTGSELHLQS